MNDTPLSKAAESKRTFWQKHIDDQKSSGLTQSRYCSEFGINKHTFCYWKTKLKPVKPETSNLFLPVSIHSEQKITESWSSGISLSIQDRYHINLDVGFNRDTLLKLIDTLESR